MPFEFVHGKEGGCRPTTPSCGALRCPSVHPAPHVCSNTCILCIPAMVWGTPGDDILCSCMCIWWLHPKEEHQLQQQCNETDCIRHWRCPSWLQCFAVTFVSGHKEIKRERSEDARRAGLQGQSPFGWSKPCAASLLSPWCGFAYWYRFCSQVAFCVCVTICTQLWPHCCQSCYELVRDWWLERGTGIIQVHSPIAVTRGWT